MNVQNVDLSALISTKICHDLINPIGAINNGLELLDATGASSSPELSLVNDSAAAATAKLNLFRLAFGDTNTSHEVKNDQVAKFIQAMYGQGRFSVNWQPQEAGFPRAEIKMATLILFCLDSSLPMGGLVNVSREQGRWLLQAQAPKVNIRSDLWAMLTDGSDPNQPSASDVHFLVARLTADQSNLKVRMTAEETGITVSF